MQPSSMEDCRLILVGQPISRTSFDFDCIPKDYKCSFQLEQRQTYKTRCKKVDPVDKVTDALSVIASCLQTNIKKLMLSIYSEQHQNKESNVSNIPNCPEDCRLILVGQPISRTSFDFDCIPKDCSCSFQVEQRENKHSNDSNITNDTVCRVTDTLSRNAFGMQANIKKVRDALSRKGFGLQANINNAKRKLD